MTYTDQDVERMHGAVVRAFAKCPSDSVYDMRFARGLLDEGVKPPPPTQREHDEARLAELGNRSLHPSAYGEADISDLFRIARRALKGYPEDQR